MTHQTLIVIGGGPAGFFSAITCAQFHPDYKIILLEKNRQLLSKVRISGGGRCNVTHSCFDPAVLVKSYPRGGNELRGPFSRFQPRDTVEWFESRGVKLKTEEDGRMFPITDNSETIIGCLLDQAKKLNIEIKTECGVDKIERTSEGFFLTLSNGSTLTCDQIVFATGSHPKTYAMLESLGHSIVPLVPSLFTFNIPDSPLNDLAGVSSDPVEVSLPAIKWAQKGPLLITHWGVSGPAVLKLSAWAARELHDLDYKTKVLLNWLPDLSEDQLRQLLLTSKQAMSTKFVGTEALEGLPKQLWKKMVLLAGIGNEQRWANITNKQLQSLVDQIKGMTLQVNGKTTYKQEFVTSGGVSLKEVNFKTMESRLCPGLYFAGEVLNIDGITGGFNFQNAWTTGWISGQLLS